MSKENLEKIGIDDLIKYLQSRSRNTDIKKEQNTKGKREWDELEISIDMHAIDTMCRIDNQQEPTVYHRELNFTLSSL